MGDDKMTELTAQDLDELAMLMLRKSANKCTRVNHEVTTLCEAALSAADLIQQKYNIPLPKEMWGETHSERYCVACGRNMCNHKLNTLTKEVICTYK